jgi:hypothetical protein
MTLLKYKLPNDNVVIWLGSGVGWGKNEGIDNVLILAGGDVLYLKTIKELSLSNNQVREDLKNLSYNELCKKYDLPDKFELWSDLQKGVKTGKYPPYIDNQPIDDFMQMVSSYISRIAQLSDRNEVTRILESIIRECHNKIISL